LTSEVTLRDSFSLSGHKGFLKGFLVAAVFVLIVILLVPVRYEANDDFGSISKLRGQGGDSADFLLPTLSTSLSWLLRSLYRSLPDFPWYGLLIYSAAFLGMSLMLSVLFRSMQGLSMLLALPLLCLLFFHIFSFASFTSASLLLQLGVLLCLMEWVVRDECPAKNAKLYACVLAIGFLIGFLLRWRMVLYTTAFGLPILFFLKRRQLTRAIPLLAVVALVMIGDRALFHLVSTDEHKAYLEYNRLRARFHDTAWGDDRGETTREALRKAGWSPEDYGFYKSWILYDNRRFNTETLRTFLRENAPKERDAFFLAGWKRLRRQFPMGKDYALALVFASLSILVYRFEDLLRSSGKNRVRIALALAVTGSGILYVMCYRFVPRVFVPLYAYFFGVCFLLSHWRTSGLSDTPNRPVRKSVILVFAVVFCALAWGHAVAQGKMDYRILERSKLEKEYVQKVLSAVGNRSTVPDPLLILMNPMSGLRSEYVHPLKELSDFTGLRIFPAGWSVNSPGYSSLLGDMGLADGWAFLAWMIDNPKALLVMFSRSGMETWRWKGLWESYFHRRVAPNRRVRLVPVYDFRNAQGAGLVFFSMRSVN
jgi:hypothetical protein